jgi:hypothetical protein
VAGRTPLDCVCGQERVEGHPGQVLAGEESHDERSTRPRLGASPTLLLGAGVAPLAHQISIPLLLAAAPPWPLELR